MLCLQKSCTGSFCDWTKPGSHGSVGGDDSLPVNKNSF